MNIKTGSAQLRFWNTDEFREVKLLKALWTFAHRAPPTYITTSQVLSAAVTTPSSLTKPKSKCESSPCAIINKHYQTSKARMRPPIVSLYLNQKKSQLLVKQDEGKSKKSPSTLSLASSTLLSSSLQKSGSTASNNDTWFTFSATHRPTQRKGSGRGLSTRGKKKKTETPQLHWTALRNTITLKKDAYDHADLSGSQLKFRFQ